MEASGSIRNVTLGDYLTGDEGKHGFVMVPFRNKHRHAYVSSPENPEKVSFTNKKETLTIPTSMADISSATNASHIFEVIDTSMKRIKPFDLRQEIQSMVPANLVVKWFGSKRVSISSWPYSKLAFVIFFEEMEQNILRVRVSTDSQYCIKASRRRLFSIVKDRKRRKFADLFGDLMEFISQTETSKKEDRRSPDSRISMFPEGFEAKVNSRLIAPLAAASLEHDQVAYLNDYYLKRSHENSSSTPECNPAICYKCQVASKTDLFICVDGMICRECIASSILRQLRLHQIPVDIPVRRLFPYNIKIVCKF
ncbi:hypothetical protein OESDEN_20318 [Oesophagostomum dentatum]|uniref:Uncharacterized protein n=1 Tax=Oesophagostomum dentatum TaxID=61180 RepID=A0A0B1S915_OESDE|nr:hypothetical protein OESDEN_20318 [Oesophagostomum dentatum]